MKRALLIVTFALATACGKAEADRSLPEPQGPPATSDISADTGDEAATDPTGPTLETGSVDEDPAEAEDADPSQAGATTDDLRVFGYATTDEAALAAGLSAIASTLVTLETHLAEQDIEAARADAQTLLAQAESLETDAEAAEARQRPLEPEDADLVAAREDAVAAFGLTAEYAASVTAIADLVLAGNLSELITAAEEAAELAGTSDDLAQSYTELNAELVAWAEANPADAARALAKYGAET